MLTQIRFVNYRCLQDVTLLLEPLTVLVGPNASGKTSIIDALIGDPPVNERDITNHDRSLPVQIGKFDDRGRRRIRKCPPGGIVDSEGDLKYSPQLLHLDITRLRQSNQVKEELRLAPDGGNLTNVFASLPRSTQMGVAASLRGLVGILNDVYAKPLSDGYHRLVFQDRWKESIWYEPPEVSDGTMLMMAFLVLQHQKPAVDLLAIEEPERSLHPYLIEQLVGMLRKMSCGQLGGRPVQVVLSTHSAELLEFARPEEVRFLSRRPDDGAVVVEQAPTESPGWEEAFAEYRESLGNAWLSGSLGGVP